MMTHDMGDLVKVIGNGLRTEKFYDPILDADQLDTITASPEKEPFDGDWDLGSNGIENPIMTGNDFKPFQKRDEMSDLFRLLFTTSWGKVSSVHLKRSG
jgi:hypothetical protein